MKIYSWNVNGIRAVDKKQALKKFIKTEQPDVICFQEIKAKSTDLDLNFPEYEKFWNSAEKPGYSGTAIWTKVSPLSVSYGLPEGLISEYELDEDAYGDPSNEGRVMAMNFEDFTLITVYTPNSKSDLSRLELREKRWDPAFLQYVTKRNESKPVLFCGDLNVAHQEIDLANPKPNEGKHGFTKEERAGFDTILAAGFHDTYREFYPDKTGAYTWWTHWANARARNVGWRIDYFMASNDMLPLISTAAIHAEQMGSDHCPISVTVDLPKHTNELTDE